MNLNLSYTTALNHDTKKCNLDLSIGTLLELYSEITEVYDLVKDAFIPDGGSNMNTWEALSRVEGTFGLISIVRKSLND